MRPEALAPVLLALEFVAFGWRINREIPLGDQGRRTWLPLADLINIASMLAVVVLCIVRPLAVGEFDRTARAMLAVGYILIAFHPVTTAAHYRLFSRRGRSIYAQVGQDYPYVTDQEIVTLSLSGFVAFVAGLSVWSAG
jgi:hypothetical protein